MAVTGAAAVLVLGAAVAAQASWSEPATATSGTMEAFSLAAPVARCDGLQVGTTNVSWTSVPGATGYRLHYWVDASLTIDVPAGTTSYELGALITGGTFRVEALRDYPQVEWQSRPSNSVAYSNLAFLLGTCSD